MPVARYPLYCHLSALTWLQSRQECMVEGIHQKGSPTPKKKLEFMCILVHSFLSLLSLTICILLYCSTNSCCLNEPAVVEAPWLLLLMLMTSEFERAGITNPSPTQEKSMKILTSKTTFMYGTAYLFLSFRTYSRESLLFRGTQ